MAVNLLIVGNRRDKNVLPITCGCTIKIIIHMDNGLGDEEFSTIQKRFDRYAKVAKKKMF